MDLKVIICVLMFFETVLTYRNFKYNDLIHADLFSNKIPRRPNHRNRHNNKLGNSVDEQIPGFMRYAPKQHDLKLKRTHDMPGGHEQDTSVEHFPLRIHRGQNKLPMSVHTK
jgi:hypothetical protein